MLPRLPKAGQTPIHGRRLIAQNLADATDKLLTEIVHLCRHRWLLGIADPAIVNGLEHVNQAIQHADAARDLLATEEVDDGASA